MDTNINKAIYYAIQNSDIDALKKVIDGLNIKVDINKLLLDTIKYSTTTNYDFINYILSKVNDEDKLDSGIIDAAISQTKYDIAKYLFERVKINISDTFINNLINDDKYLKFFKSIINTDNIIFIIEKILILVNTNTVVDNNDKIYKLLMFMLKKIKRKSTSKNAAIEKVIKQCAKNIKQTPLYPVGFFIADTTDMYCNDKEKIVKSICKSTYKPIYRYDLLNIDYVDKNGGIVYNIEYPNVYITQKSLISILINEDTIFKLIPVGKYEIGEIDGKIRHPIGEKMIYTAEKSDLL